MIQQIKLKARNGALLSVVVGENMYCTPREDGPQDYTHVECGVWKDSNVPASWMDYSDGPRRGDGVWVFGYLPIELISDWFEVNKPCQSETK